MAHKADSDLLLYFLLNVVSPPSLDQGSYSALIVKFTAALRIVTYINRIDFPALNLQGEISVALFWLVMIN